MDTYNGRSVTDAYNLFTQKRQQIQGEQRHCWIEQVFSYEIIFFHFIISATKFSEQNVRVIHLSSVRAWFVIHIAVTSVETHCPPPNCAHIHSLVSINAQQVSIRINYYNFFSAWNNPMTKLYFVRTFNPSADLPGCLSAAISKQVKKENDGL